MTMSILRILFSIIFAMAVASCSNKRITKANVDEVTANMSKKQVESILGPATEVANKDLAAAKMTTYTYRQGKDTVVIVFKDDKLQTKESTLSD